MAETLIRDDGPRVEGEFRVVAHDSVDSQRSQWTIKGIDTAAVELAREAAKKSGMKLGAWVSVALSKAASGKLEEATQPDEVNKKIDDLSNELARQIQTLSEKYMLMATELQNIHAALFRVVLAEHQNSITERTENS